MKKGFVFWLVTLIVVFCIVEFGNATEYQVVEGCHDVEFFGVYGSIQAAISVAEDGDTIIVQPGTYCENIYFDGKNIVLRSTIRAGMTQEEIDEVAGTTIIDGGWNGTPTVQFSGDEYFDIDAPGRIEERGCILSGFTITGGWADYGAGINGTTNPDCDANYAFPLIAFCFIGGNHANEGGGGIYKISGSFFCCEISANQSVKGGGVANCGAEFVGCSFIDNRAGDGAVFCESSAWITDCRFLGNEADRGAIACHSTTFGEWNVNRADGNWATEGDIMFESTSGYD